MIRIAPRPLTAAAFAAFGAVVEPPERPGERAFYTRWLGSGRPDATPRLHVNHVLPVALPCTVARLERHPFAAQTFVPLDVSRYLVTVAPTAADGGPDAAGLQCFLAAGTIGVAYAPGVWHGSAAVLDRPGHFAVVMWRADAPGDDVFADLPAPVTIAPAESGAHLGSDR